jgi:hypothetical protein
MSTNLKHIDIFPNVKTLTTVNTTLTEIILPLNATKITIQPQKALYLCTSGTDGGAVGSDRFEIPANQPLEITLTTTRKRAAVIYIAGQTQSGSVNVLLEF